MNSLDYLKQELINQKTVIEEKGFSVQTAHLNPSPSEITSAISNMQTANFAQATATEIDVTAGKTFYAGDNNLKTGTRGDGYDYASFTHTMLSAEPPTNLNVVLPSGIENIRTYCFYNIKEGFSGEVTIPEGVKTIGRNAFSGTNATLFHYPSTVTEFSDYAFHNNQCLTHLEIPDSVTSTGTYVFADNSSAETIYIGRGITTLLGATFRKIEKVKTITIPSNITTIRESNFTTVTKVTDVYVEGQPFTISSSNFFDQHNTSLKFWIDFAYFDQIYNTTNIAKVLDHIISQVTINEGQSFPTCQTAVEWYSSIDDALNRTNQVSSPTSAGVYFAKFAL